MSVDNETLFDPADQETVELLPPEITEESAFRPDTNGDPEGVEARAEKPPINLPDFFFKRYHLDDMGFPTYNKSTVEAIMQVFDLKKGSGPSFTGKTDEDVEAEQVYFDTQVNTVADGVKQLLEVDPQTTGISYLQLTTRTWSEFVSIAFEYSDSLSSISQNDEMPVWLIQREEKMLQLGRKARILSGACEILSEDFGLKSTSLDRGRVQNEVERRLQRLAEWNFSRYADVSGQVKNNMNQATVLHAQSMFANA